MFFVSKFDPICNRVDTLQYHGGLRSRELCQAHMLLVFLTPRQALSSHPRVFIMILWESMNFLFQVAGTGALHLTLGSQVQHSPSYTRDPRARPGQEGTRNRSCRYQFTNTLRLICYFDILKKASKGLKTFKYQCKTDINLKSFFKLSTLPLLDFKKIHQIAAKLTR